jgi:hypothetical protein
MRKKRATSQIDILERVLNRGIVIDAVASVGVLGIDHVVDIDARVVVASIDTYLQYARPRSEAGSVARPVRALTGAEKSVSAPVPKKAKYRRPSRFGSSDVIRAHGLGVRLGHDRHIRKEDKKS